MPDIEPVDTEFSDQNEDRIKDFSSSEQNFQQLNWLLLPTP